MYGEKRIETCGGGGGSARLLYDDYNTTDSDAATQEIKGNIKQEEGEEFKVWMFAVCRVRCSSIASW